MVSIFLAYNTPYFNIASDLKLLLESKGHYVWMDEGNILIGDDIPETIETEIKKADIFIPLLSNYFENSKYTMRELELAKERENIEKRVFILPLVVEEYFYPSIILEKRFLPYYDDASKKKSFAELENQIFSQNKNCNDVDLPDRIEDLLDSLDFKNIVIKNGNIYMLAGFKDEQPKQIYYDPDGTQSYLKRLFLIKIENQKIIYRKITLNAYQHTALDIQDKYIKVFLNMKTRTGTYGMSGILYTLDQEALQVKHAGEIFENENWGWFPIIDKNDVIHFSFDGYFKYQNIDRLESISPDNMSEIYNKHLQNQSKNIFFPKDSLKEKLMEFIKKGRA